MAFENLPGMPVELVDGNLDVLENARTPVVLVLGTGSSGASETPVLLGRSEEALITFGRTGTLARGCLEAAEAGAKTIVAYRVGATSAIVTGIGDATGVAGITVETTAKDDEAGLDVFISWDDDEERLRIWNADGDLIYDNNPSGDLLDAGQVIVSGTGSGVTGASFGTTTTGVRMDLLDEDEVGGIAGCQYTAGTDGSSLTKMEMYEALQDAYRNLETAPVDIVVPMHVYLDDLNIADDAALAGSDEDFLGWFKETEEDDGTFTYEWSTAALRPADYHEVNFAYQLANFCYSLSTNDNNAVGVIGVNRWASTALADVSAWVGKSPTVDSLTGDVTVDGTGLLGNKFMAGSTDQVPGFFATASQYLDDTEILVDRNNHNVDIGKYLNVVSTWPTHYNTFDATGQGYRSSGAANYGGLISTLPPKSAPTNKLVSQNVKLPFRLSKTKLNALAGTKYVTFKNSDRGVVVVTADTAATSDSDYQRLTTVRIVNHVIDDVRAIGEPYIGEGQTTLERSALESAITKNLSEKVKDHEIQRFAVTVTATPSQQIRGECTVDITIVPAFELRTIRIILSLARE